MRAGLAEAGDAIAQAQQKPRIWRGGLSLPGCPGAPEGPPIDVQALRTNSQQLTRGSDTIPGVSAPCLVKALCARCCEDCAEFVR